MPELDHDLLANVKGCMIQQMTINEAAPGDTNTTVVLTTAETELDPIYEDLRAKLYAKLKFTTYSKVIDYQFNDGQPEPHQFTFTVGDFRIPDGPPIGQ